MCEKISKEEGRGSIERERRKEVRINEPKGRKGVKSWSARMMCLRVLLPCIYVRGVDV
jgi:hypothetical protein